MYHLRPRRLKNILNEINVNRVITQRAPCLSKIEGIFYFFSLYIVRIVSSNPEKLVIDILCTEYAQEVLSVGRKLNLKCS